MGNKKLRSLVSYLYDLEKLHSKGFDIDIKYISNTNGERAYVVCIIHPKYKEIDRKAAEEAAILVKDLPIDNLDKNRLFNDNFYKIKTELLNSFSEKDEINGSFYIKATFSIFEEALDQAITIALDKWKYFLDKQKG